MKKIDWTARTKKIISILKKEYPDAKCTLDHKNALELVVATIMAAQCTDERVNIVTKDLFKTYRSVKDFATCPQETMETAIKSTGFFRNKAKSIINCCQKLLERHGGEVPQTMEELTALDGVGRKTANVILGNIFNIPSIIVDTHMKRLSGLIGLTKETDPDKIEFDLMPKVPKESWTLFSHLIVAHGRTVCIARKPHCDSCSIASLCDYGQDHQSLWTE